MGKLGIVMLILGMTMAESESLWIPAVVIGAGLLLILTDKKI